MRDIDREIGIGTFGRDAHADDAHAVARNRRIGELLLRADEMEETLETLRTEPADAPLQPGRSREESLRALERRARLERERLETLARREPIDYDAVARAMPMR
jgi:hypothetical protein